MKPFGFYCSLAGPLDGVYLRMQGFDGTSKDVVSDIFGPLGWDLLTAGSEFEFEWAGLETKWPSLNCYCPWLKFEWLGLGLECPRLEC